MSQFGKTAFSGSRFMFWTLAPVLLVCAVLSGMFAYGVALDGKFFPAAIGGTLSLVLLCAILVLYNPQRFPWAGRLVTATIFAAYLAYAIDEWFFTEHEFGWDQPRSATTPRNALAGLICIGLPCLWYTGMGRFSRTAEPEPMPRPRPPGLANVEVLGMAPRVERPFAAEEIELLKKASAFSGTKPRRMLLWAIFWSGLMVASIFGLAWLTSPSEHANPRWMEQFIGYCFLVPVLTFYGAYASLRAFFAQRRAARVFAENVAPRVRAALDLGRASVVRVEAKSVIEIEEDEDEGAAWLFALADGTTLYVRGGDYFPADAEMPWPAKRFEIVRAAANDQWIGLFSKGPDLECDLKVPPGEMPDDFTWAEHPASESVLAGSPVENLHKLGYEPERE